MHELADAFLERLQATLEDLDARDPLEEKTTLGPLSVAMFFPVKDEAAAIALANDSDFGLGGSVFTGDVTRGKRVASQTDTGIMFINNISWSDAQLPFGGIKNSGSAASWAAWASRSS